MDALVDPQPRLAVINPKVTAAALKAAIEAGEDAAWLNVVVTPALARLMLAYNRAGETNRKLNPDYVARQADEISHKRWDNTGEPLIFSNAQLLNDGQHRLNAIVKSGVNAVMDIRFGISRHAVNNTNSGMKRSPQHALQIAGVSAGPMHGALVRMVCAYEAGGLPSSLKKARVSNGEVVDRVLEDARLQTAVRIGAGFPRYIQNSAVLATIYFGLCTANAATVGEYAEVLRDGGGSTSNPPHRLREHCLAHGGQYKTEERAALFARAIQAWNAFKTATAIGRWWKPGDPFPVVEGYRSQSR